MSVDLPELRWLEQMISLRRFFRAKRLAGLLTARKALELKVLSWFKGGTGLTSLVHDGTSAQQLQFQGRSKPDLGMQFLG